MITLREILKMQAFLGFKVIAGTAGLDRDVSTVSVMDAPDIYKWMKGGEFLITSAYSIKDKPGYIKTLIENLDRKGAAAFGVKFGRFISEFPKEALEKAEELNFPIVHIPNEFAFTDVINPVLREVIDSQSKKMIYTENIHKIFTKMVLEDESIPTILHFLEKYIHCRVYFLDTCFYKTYASTEEENESVLFQKLKKQIPHFKDVAKLLREYQHYKLYINEEDYGYIVLGERLEEYDVLFEDYYKTAVEQAGTVLILKIQKQLATAQIEANYREQFVQDLLLSNFKSKEEIMNRAAIYNWNLSQGGVAVIVDVDHFKQLYLHQLNRDRNRTMENSMKRIFHICRQIVDKEYEQSVFSKFSDQIVFIISGGSKDKGLFLARLKEVFTEVKGEIKRTTEFSATIGIGNYKDDIAEIPASWEEARKAIRISQNRMKEDTIASYHELGAFKLLSLISSSEEADEFYNDYIEKLREYDDHCHTELLNTVHMLVACGWNMKETSEKLFIHYNSMKYRYQKISRILNVDLKEQEIRLNMELALKLYQIRIGV